MRYLLTVEDDGDFSLYFRGQYIRSLLFDTVEDLKCIEIRGPYGSPRTANTQCSCVEGWLKYVIGDLRYVYLGGGNHSLEISKVPLVAFNWRRRSSETGAVIADMRRFVQDGQPVAANTQEVQTVVGRWIARLEGSLQRAPDDSEPVADDDESETTIYTRQLDLLRAIVTTSEELIWARKDSLRAEQLGGITAVKSRHAKAVREHTQFIALFDKLGDY